MPILKDGESLLAHRVNNLGQVGSGRFTGQCMRAVVSVLQRLKQL